MNPTNKDKGFLKIVENNKINNEMNLAKKKNSSRRKHYRCLLDSLLI